MANETVALDLGLPVLSSLAHKASDSLHSTICSYPPLPDFVRDLLGELEALNQLLDSLEETVNAPTEADLSALAIPLRRYGEACRQFEEAIEKRLLQPSGGRTNSREWLKIKYMGENIDVFKRILSAYKMTIIVALTDESLYKTSSVDAESLENDKDFVETATISLRARIENIDEKVEALSGQRVTKSDEDATELLLVEAERLSLEKSLEICCQLSDHIEQIQLASQRSDSSIGSIDRDTHSRVDNRSWANFSTFDNYSRGDASQYIVSTKGIFIRGKNRGLGWRTRQCAGHLDDVTVQNISRDWSTMNMKNTGNAGQSSQGSTTPAGDETRSNLSSKFKNRYRKAFLLPANSKPDGRTTSSRARETVSGSPPRGQVAETVV